RLMMSRPCAASVVARASTAKAFSSPMRSKAAMVLSMSDPSLIFSLGPPHHRRRELLDRGRADLLHHRIGLGAQDLEYLLAARLAEGAQSPDIRPPDAARGRAHAQRLDHVGAAPETGIDQDRDAAVHRLDDLRQRVDGRAPAVLAARAVVRHDDAVE